MSAGEEGTQGGAIRGLVERVGRGSLCQWTHTLPAGHVVAGGVAGCVPPLKGSRMRLTAPDEKRGNRREERREERETRIEPGSSCGWGGLRVVAERFFYTWHKHPLTAPALDWDLAGPIRQENCNGRQFVGGCGRLGRGGLARGDGGPLDGAIFDKEGGCR